MNLNDVCMQRFCTNPDAFLREFIAPSIDLILVGEDHWEPRHSKNEFKLMDELMRSRGKFQLGIEYMDSRDSDLFLSGNQAKMIQEVEKIYGRGSNESKMIASKIEYALGNKMRVIPLSLDERKGEYDNYEKEMHISRELAKCANNGVATIAVLGNAHLALPDRKLIPCLDYPKERTMIVLQDEHYEPGIETVFGKDRQTFRINCSL